MAGDRLSFVHLITNLEGGGTENFLHQILAHRPDPTTHRVCYLKKDGVIGARIRELGIPVEATPSLSAIRLMLRREKPDILHTCLYWASQVGRIIGRLSRVPMIVSSQRSIDVWQKPWHRAIDRLTLPFCDLVIANSAVAADVVRQRRGSAGRPIIARIDNGIDPIRIRQLERSICRRVYKIPDDALLGGSLMRLHEEKGAERIPDFTRALLEAEPQLHLMIGGIGPMEPRLRQATADQAWSDRLHWIGWEDDTSRFLSALDFYWSLAREESFPQALLEASALGVPWVAPDVGGTSDLQQAGAIGILYKGGSTVAAQEATHRLLRDIMAFKSRAQTGTQSIAARFSVGRTAQSFFEQIRLASATLARSPASKYN